MAVRATVGRLCFNSWIKYYERSVEIFALSRPFACCMNMIFLFPSDFFQKSKPDEMFQDQFEAFVRAGHSCFVTNVEEGGPVYPRVPFPGEHALLYRGFMLTPDAYRALFQRLQTAGASPLTSPEEYRLCHHIPNWYRLIEAYTPETIICKDTTEAIEAIQKLDWDGFFIKDYVKSLKTSVGSLITDAQQIPLVISEMEKYRGTIEGGICIRKAEQWNPGTETRAFIYKHRAFLPGDAEFPVELSPVLDAIQAPFYSLDFVTDVNGRFRIVEIGDGQVSDLVGWSTAEFVRIFESDA